MENLPRRNAGVEGGQMGWVENPASLWGPFFHDQSQSRRCCPDASTRWPLRCLSPRLPGAAWFPLAQTAREALPGSLQGSEGPCKEVRVAQDVDLAEKKMTHGRMSEASAYGSHVSSDPQRVTGRVEVALVLCRLSPGGLQYPEDSVTWLPSLFSLQWSDPL